jgi:hydroxyethylthiazole kinase
VIRGNASEIITLGGGQSSSKGVDAHDTVELAQQAATTLARHLNAVVAVTGPVDFVTDGKRAARLVGGSAFMPQVTALGCSLTCLIGAFVGAYPHEPYDATVAALACFNIAGERAAHLATGPGSFSWQFIDALAALDEASLNEWSGLSMASL